MMKFLLLSVVSLLVLCPSVTGQRRQDQPISEELHEIAQQKVQQIKGEISEGKNEWAGTYYDGDHHPTMFMWSSDRGFLVTSSLHTTSPSWLNFGKVSFEKGVLTIFPELPKEHKSAHIMPTELMAIRWDKQYFLVPSGELLAFAYAVHSRSDAQMGQFYLKWSDRELSRNGLPAMPPEYTKYLRMKPIRARVTSVKKGDDALDTSLTLNVGTRQGLTEGMMLYAIRKSGLQISIRIDQVSETTATATLFDLGGPNGEEEVKPGSIFSSRMPRGFIEPG